MVASTWRELWLPVVANFWKVLFFFFENEVYGPENVKSVMNGGYYFCGIRGMALLSEILYTLPVDITWHTRISKSACKIIASAGCPCILKIVRVYPLSIFYRKEKRERGNPFHFKENAIKNLVTRTAFNDEGLTFFLNCIKKGIQERKALW